METVLPGDWVIFVGSSKPSFGTPHHVRRVDGERILTACGRAKTVSEVLDREADRPSRIDDCRACTGVEKSPRP